MKYSVDGMTPWVTLSFILEEIDERLGKLEKPVDYQVKYNELRATIQEQLKILKPWYQNGNVNNPMDAISALKIIHCEVFK